MTATARSKPPFNRARFLRDLHLYAGLLFAPCIIFFAATGALQLFGLHEMNRDSGYSPPKVIEKLSEVHIHQRFAEKPRRPPGAAPKPKAAAAAPSPPPAPPLGRTLAKSLFLASALGLILSALLGLWMGFTQGRRRGLALVLFLIGAALPIVLLAL